MVGGPSKSRHPDDGMAGGATSMMVETEQRYCSSKSYDAIIIKVCKNKRKKYMGLLFDSVDIVCCAVTTFAAAASTL